MKRIRKSIRINEKRALLNWTSEIKNILTAKAHSVTFICATNCGKDNDTDHWMYLQVKEADRNLTQNCFAKPMIFRKTKKRGTSFCIAFTNNPLNVTQMTLHFGAQNSIKSTQPKAVYKTSISAVLVKTILIEHNGAFRLRNRVSLISSRLYLQWLERIRRPTV